MFSEKNNVPLPLYQHLHTCNYYMYNESVVSY